jgi:predicted RND superfamily exporter protein
MLRSTGGAVMMSCASTIIGYSAMWFSINGAINTFATLANIGKSPVSLSPRSSCRLYCI